MNIFGVEYHLLSRIYTSDFVTCDITMTFTFCFWLYTNATITNCNDDNSDKTETQYFLF